MSNRTFESKPAVREQTPLLLGLVGPSASGKTFSALRLATGIQRVSGGSIFMIDTEAKRGLHYAERFSFEHLPFMAPFSPLDYLAAVEHCVKKGAKVVIIDSMSHEHEGPGGVLEMHEAELTRLAGDNWEKRNKMTFLAWAKPKQQRRRFINSLLQLQIHVLCCFRAKQKLKIVRGQEPVARGFMPIAGEEFIYEMTAKFWLHPGANGFPSWQSEHEDERGMMKLPEQFRGFFKEQVQLSEDIGQKLAEWAAGKPGGAPKDAATEAAKILKERCEVLLATYEACRTKDAFDAAEKTRGELWKALTGPGERTKVKAAADAAAKRIAEAPPAEEPDRGDAYEGDGQDGGSSDLFGGDTTQEQMDALKR